MSNPLIDDMKINGAMPAVEVALPTRGYFYPEGEVLHPDADPDEIAVSHISILDESTLRDPLMMISGHAVAKMIKRICPSIADPASLCEIDVQAILIASRIASSGPKMKLEHTCKCEHSNQIEIDLNEHIQNFSSYTPEAFAEFDVELPVTNQTVRLRPMMYGDSVDLNMGMIKASVGAEALRNNQDDTLTEEFIQLYSQQFTSTLITNISAITSSIFFVKTTKGATVPNRDVIKEWVEKLQQKDIKAITDRIEKINRDITERSRVIYQCQSCGEESAFYLELDPQKLFMLPEDSEIETNSSVPSKSTKKAATKSLKKSQRLS